MKKKRFTLLLASVLTCTLFAATAQAQWTVVEDFDGLLPGDILGQNGWTNDGSTGHDSFDVGLDPTNPLNQVLISQPRPGVDSDPRDDHAVAKDFATGIPLGGVGTVFFRARYTAEEGDLLDTLAGATQNAANTVSSSTGIYANHAILSSRNDPLGPDLEADLVARELLGGGEKQADIEVDTWYLLWLVFDNNVEDVNTIDRDEDFFDMYIQGGAFTTQTQISDDLFFRNPDDDTIRAFGFRNNENGHTTQAFFDDIYIDPSGVNLRNPIPEPAGLTLLGLAGVSLLALKRRNR